MITNKKLKTLTLIWENKDKRQQKNNEKLRKQVDELAKELWEFHEKVNTARIIPTEEYLHRYGYSFADKEYREWVLRKTSKGYEFEFINYNDFEQEERNAEQFYIFKTMKQAQKFIFDRLV